VGGGGSSLHKLGWSRREGGRKEILIGAVIEPSAGRATGALAAGSLISLVVVYEYRDECAYLFIRRWRRREWRGGKGTRRWHRGLNGRSAPSFFSPTSLPLRSLFAPSSLPLLSLFSRSSLALLSLFSRSSSRETKRMDRIVCVHT
jgi:hypothetical protein